MSMKIGSAPKRRALLPWGFLTGSVLSLLFLLAYVVGNRSGTPAYQVPHVATQVSRALAESETHLQKYERKLHNVTTNVSSILVEPLTHDTAVICAIMKNDERYLQEWLDYYLLVLGFDHIYLYDNSDSFNIATWMEETEFVQQYRNRVTLLWLPGYKQQLPAFRDCGARVKARNHTWAFFPDSDEYLMLRDQPNLIDFCKRHLHRGYLGIQRRFFGTSGQSTYLPLPTTLRFQCREPHWHHMIKPFVRVMDLDHHNIKSPHYQPMLNGTEMLLINPGLAIIYHYFSKSIEENAEKKARGGATSGIKYSAGLEFAKKGLRSDGTPIYAGIVRDNLAWKRLKQSVPRYAEYENHELLTNLTWPC